MLETDKVFAGSIPENYDRYMVPDALVLPFENATFDLVCCQFGAMFFPDRASGYREARRVLKPGGYFYSMFGIASRRTFLRMT